MKTSTLKNLRISYVLSARALEQIKKHLPAVVIAVEETKDSSTIYTFPSALRGVIYYRRNYPTIRATSLTDIAIADNVVGVHRFTVNYLLYSSKFGNRYTISIGTSEGEAIPSRAAPFKNKKALFASATWLEREAWDLFGLYFSKNPNLRRILTDYGFSGHALRKDFPLSGFVEYSYNPAIRSISIGDAELNQELREHHEFKK